MAGPHPLQEGHTHTKVWAQLVASCAPPNISGREAAAGPLGWEQPLPEVTRSDLPSAAANCLIIPDEPMILDQNYPVK